MQCQNRGAWTLIELIFVIVAIGILAAIAIPKLAATRDDAQLAKDVSNMSICLRDAEAQYVATDTDLSVGNSIACDAVKCYSITYSVNGLNFIVAIKTGAPNYCSDINNIGGHLIGTYQFSGTLISI